MSTGDGSTGAPAGQEKKATLTEIVLRFLERFIELWLIEIRLKCGAIYGADIELLYGTSEKTTAEWEYGGLEPFRPGTGAFLYRVADVEKYFNAKQTFTRAEREAERKAKAKAKNSQKKGGGNNL